MVKVKKNTIVKDGLECLKHANWSTLITLLSLISWGNLNNFLTVNDALFHFYDIVYPVLVTK